MQVRRIELGESNSYNDVKPLFICLGVPKSATTWIHRQLEAHPEVGCTYSKEINYWSSNFWRGPSWYASQFPHDRHYTIFAEVSVGYVRKEPLLRLANAVPESKFMISLRDPYERAWSSYWQSVRTGDFSGSLEEAVNALPKIINDSIYSDGIQAYRQNLPLENLHIALYDQLLEDPLEYVRRLYEFLGVDTEFVPTSLNSQINVGRRRSSLDVLLAQSQRISKKLGLKRKHLVGLGLWGVLEDIYRRLGKNNPVPAMSSRDMAFLDRRLRPEVTRLEDLLERDLSHWLP